MKKLLVLVAATALLASCTQKEDVNNEVNNGETPVVEVNENNGEVAENGEANAEEAVVDAVEKVAEEAAATTEAAVEEVVEAVESAK